MNAILQKIAAASALSAGLVGAAQATTYVVPLTATTGTTQTGSFSATVTAAGSFTDDFIFTSPPPLAAMTFAELTDTGVTFGSVTLLVFGTTTSLPLTGSLTATGFTLSDASVSSALYKLEITGTATAGAKYTGSITGTSFDATPPVVTAPVPEPGTWALMLAGLAATGASLRRKRMA